MPTYEYQCKNCAHRFDLRQGFDADPVETCPLCQSECRRVIHAPPVIYKGSGFYTTDYGRKNFSADEQAEKKGPDGTPSSNESSSTGKESDKSSASASNAD